MREGQGGALLPVTSRQSQGKGHTGFLPLSQGFILGLPASDKASRRPMLCPNSSPGMKESGGSGRPGESKNLKA